MVPSWASEFFAGGPVPGITDVKLPRFEMLFANIHPPGCDNQVFSLEMPVTASDTQGFSIGREHHTSLPCANGQACAVSLRCNTVLVDLTSEMTDALSGTVVCAARGGWYLEQHSL